MASTRLHLARIARTGCVAVAALATFGAPPAHAADAKPVMVYAVAYANVCGSESAVGYATAMSDSRNYNQARTSLQDSVSRRYPNARVRAGSSKFDYGDNAGGVAILQWPGSGTGNCRTNVISVNFGADDGDAMRRAQQRVPGNRQHSILMHRYFPRVVSY